MVDSPRQKSKSGQETDESDQPDQPEKGNNQDSESKTQN